MLTIHDSAKLNFDSKVLTLINLIQRVNKNPAPQIINPEYHIKTNINENDIIRIKQSLRDSNGKIVSRFFTHDGHKYGILPDNYYTLQKLAESIQHNISFNNIASIEYTESSIFDWISERYKDKVTNDSFIDYFISKLSNDVKKFNILIPLSNIYVENEFIFCGAKIKNLSKQLIDDFEKNFRQKKKDEKAVDIIFDRFRSNYQGRAVAEFCVESEPIFAQEFCLNEANKITDLLGIYSPAIYAPNIECGTKPKGMERNLSFTAIISHEDSTTITESLLNKGSMQTRYLSDKRLQEYGECGLFIISKLATKKTLSNFEKSILNMAYLYSKAAFTPNPLEKIIYILSSLESILLKNESEPIQQNLAERIALFIDNKLNTRKDIIKNIRNIYSFRSKFLHHGHTLHDLEEFSIFYKNIWLFFVKLVLSFDKFSTKQDFINTIDDIKLT